MGSRLGSGRSGGRRPARAWGSASTLAKGLSRTIGGVSTSPASEFGPRGGWYAPYRTIHVPSDLARLRGPTVGRVKLPLELDASARSIYDLSKPRRRDRMYEIVIVDGGSDEDFAA